MRTGCVENYQEGIAHHKQYLEEILFLSSARRRNKWRMDQEAHSRDLIDYRMMQSSIQSLFNRRTRIKVGNVMNMMETVVYHITGQVAEERGSEMNQNFGASVPFMRSSMGPKNRAKFYREMTTFDTAMRHKLGVEEPKNDVPQWVFNWGLIVFFAVVIKMCDWPVAL